MWYRKQEVLLDAMFGKILKYVVTIKAHDSFHSKSITEIDMLYILYTIWCYCCWVHIRHFRLLSWKSSGWGVNSDWPNHCPMYRWPPALLCSVPLQPTVFFDNPCMPACLLFPVLPMEGCQGFQDPRLSCREY